LDHQKIISRKKATALSKVAIKLPHPVYFPYLTKFKKLSRSTKLHPKKPKFPNFFSFFAVSGLFFQKTQNIFTIPNKH
jgi:hypothetical protein